MNKRVCIIAPPIPEGKHVQSAFMRLGLEADLLQFQDFIPRSLVGRVCYRFLRSYRHAGIARSFNGILQERLIPLLSGINAPTLLLFIKPHLIEDRNKLALRQAGIPIVSWSIDSLSRYPGQDSLNGLAQHRFFMDRGDVSSPDSSWLPLGYDEQYYLPSTDRPIDIVFIGFLKQPHYASRKQCLLELASSDLPNRYRCVFIGSTGYRAKDASYKRRMNLEFKGYVSPQEYAWHITHAKVGVNIHQDDGIEPVNPSFFAIPGARVCQLTDSRPYLSQWLAPEREYAEFEHGKFLQTLRALLADPVRSDRIADGGYAAAVSRHTYVQRSRAILAKLGLVT